MNDIKDKTQRGNFLFPCLPMQCVLKTLVYYLEGLEYRPSVRSC